MFYSVIGRIKYILVLLVNFTLSSYFHLKNELLLWKNRIIVFIKMYKVIDFLKKIACKQFR